jgi:hypothetical protein
VPSLLSELVANIASNSATDEEKESFNRNLRPGSGFQRTVMKHVWFYYTTGQVTKAERLTVVMRHLLEYHDDAARLGPVRVPSLEEDHPART